MDFLNTVTGKVVSGICGLVVVIAGISWWRMDAGTKSWLLSSTGKIVAWFGVVLLLPWATFFVSSWAGKRDSNAVGALVVFLYTALEATMLLWLFDWSPGGGTAWSFVVVGVLVAGVYNLLVCDWIAEKLA